MTAVPDVSIETSIGTDYKTFVGLIEDEVATGEENLPWGRDKTTDRIKFTSKAESEVAKYCRTNLV